MIERLSYPRLAQRLALPQLATRQHQDIGGYWLTLRQTGSETYTLTERPHFYPVSFFTPDRAMTEYTRMVAADQRHREERAAYLSAVYAANERELALFRTARASFTASAARFVRSRFNYWSQVEGAGDAAAWREAGDQLGAILDQMAADIRSEAVFLAPRDYISDRLT